MFNPTTGYEIEEAEVESFMEFQGTAMAAKWVAKQYFMDMANAQEEMFADDPTRPIPNIDVIHQAAVDYAADMLKEWSVSVMDALTALKQQAKVQPVVSLKLTFE